jgi:ABC-type ATPase with predicted acetyltransferase domain
MSARSKCTKIVINNAYNWVVENGLRLDDSDTLGANKQEFCRAMGISMQTFYNWVDEKSRYFNCEFLEQLTNANDEFKKNIVGRLVASSIQRALGYDVDMPTTKYKDKRGKPVVAEKIVKKLHVPADVTMLRFLLTNLAPNQFKERQEISSKQEQTIKVLTDQEFLDSIPEETLYQLADTLQNVIEDVDATIISDDEEQGNSAEDSEKQR